jgi:hypothetical protein
VADYAVIVGNLGTVHTSTVKARAVRTFRLYKGFSKDGVGRAAGEDVTLMRDDEPLQEYIGKLARTREN